MTSNYDFMKALMLEAGFIDNEHLDPLIEDGVAVFEDWLRTELVKLLPESQREAFGQLTTDEHASDEAFYTFLQTHIADFDTKMGELYDTFAVMYKERTAKYSKK